LSLFLGGGSGSAFFFSSFSQCFPFPDASSGNDLQQLVRFTTVRAFPFPFFFFFARCWACRGVLQNSVRLIVKSPFFSSSFLRADSKGRIKELGEKISKDYPHRNSFPSFSPSFSLTGLGQAAPFLEEKRGTCYVDFHGLLPPPPPPPPPPGSASPGWAKRPRH